MLYIVLFMLKPADQYFDQRMEPSRSCLLFLRELILGLDADVTEAWQYKMPFYCYRGRRFCYLWEQKKTGIPYLGVVEGLIIDHPSLIQENRSRMKIMLIDPNEDLPLDTINEVLHIALVKMSK